MMETSTCPCPTQRRWLGISRQLLKKYVNNGKFPSPDATQHETRELWLKKNIFLYQRGLQRKDLGEMVATYPLHHFNTVKGLLRKVPFRICRSSVKGSVCNERWQ